MTDIYLQHCFPANDADYTAPALKILLSKAGAGKKFQKSVDNFENLYYTNEAVKLMQTHGVLAQLGEHLPYKQRVIGSSPIGPIFTET